MKCRHNKCLKRQHYKAKEVNEPLSEPFILEIMQSGIRIDRYTRLAALFECNNIYQESGTRKSNTNNLCNSMFIHTAQK